MNNNGQYQLHPLLAQLLQGQGQQVSQNANDILNGTGVGQQLQGREAYLNQANSHAADTLSNLLHNNPGGYVTNAAPLQGTQNQNVTTDNSMTLNALLGIIGQATGLQNNAVSTLGNVSNNLNDNATTQRGQTLQYGGNDPLGQVGGKSGISPLEAKNAVIKHGGIDLFQGLDDAAQYRLAQDIVNNGGVAAYRAKNPGASHLSPQEQQLVTNLNHGLTMAYQAQDRLQNSKGLQDALRNPLKKQFIRAFLATGQTGLLSGVGLSDEDVNALRNMESLNNTSIAGQTKVKLGVDSSPGQNLDYLKQMTGLMNNDLNAFTQHKGFGKATDIPGFNAKPPISGFNK